MADTRTKPRYMTYVPWRAHARTHARAHCGAHRLSQQLPLLLHTALHLSDALRRFIQFLLPGECRNRMVRQLAAFGSTNARASVNIDPRHTRPSEALMRVRPSTLTQRCS